MSGFTELDGIIQDFSAAEEATIEGGRCGGNHGKKKFKNKKFKGKFKKGKIGIFKRLAKLEERVLDLEKQVDILNEEVFGGEIEPEPVA